MGEQIGTKLVGSTTFSQLFKSSLGPNDVIACVVVGDNAATYPLGAAMVNSTTGGLKRRYTNAASVNNEAVGTGDGSTTTFDLAQSNVIASSFKAYGSANQVFKGTISAGTGAGGVDQVVFDIAPASGAIKADYDYHTTPLNGPCVLMKAITTTNPGPKVTEDGARDGSVDTALVLDSAGAAVDSYFKAALPKMVFD